MDNKPEKRISRKSVITAVVMTALFFIFMWNLDIAITTLMNGLTMYNGMFTANAAVMCHVSFIGMAVLFVSAIFYKWEA